MKPCKHLGKRTNKTFPEYGLGDFTDNLLQKIGITKERWEAITGGCGCNKRHHLLNAAGAALGGPKGIGPELKKQLDIIGNKNRRIFGCPLMGECVQISVDDVAARTAMLKLGVTPCGNCARYEHV